MQCFMKHLFLSVKEKLLVSIFIHKCLMMLNNTEYKTFKLFVKQMSNYLFLISFQLMFYKTSCYRLARALRHFCLKSVQSALSDLLTTSTTHDTFFRHGTKHGLILIGLELNSNAKVSFEHC